MHVPTTNEYGLPQAAMDVLQASLIDTLERNPEGVDVEPIYRTISSYLRGSASYQRTHEWGEDKAYRYLQELRGKGYIGFSKDMSRIFTYDRVTRVIHMIIEDNK